MNAMTQAHNEISDATAAVHQDHPQFRPSPSPVLTVEGHQYMRDTSNRLVPLETIAAKDLLIDETVNKIVGFATHLSDQVARYKRHTLNDVEMVQALLAQEYNHVIGGEKGNIQITNFAGTKRVTVKVADVIEFGPELQIAKELVSKCVRTWSEDAGPELRAIALRAFDVDQQGRVNRSELLRLLRMDINNEDWRSAMRAIIESMRPVGTKEYLNIQVRENARGKWTAVTIDLAAA